MRIGYARVSTHLQNLELQQDALTRAGCEKVIVEVASGKAVDRNGLEKVRELLRKGDVLVVWRLDRLGRSLRQLIELLSELEEKEIGFHSLQESLDTTTPGGKLIFHIFGALAEFERNLIRERTNAGLAAARARGRVGGRAKSLNSSEREMVVEIYHQKKYSVMDICNLHGISKPTLYAYVREHRPRSEEPTNQAV